MRVQATAQDNGALARAIVAATAHAVTAGITAAGTGLKNELRAQVAAGGLGQRLGNTWRARIYPEGRNSTDAAAYIWSKAPKIIDAFERGVTIRSHKGLFLAIPMPAAGKRGLSPSGSGRGRITPGGWERRTGLKLRFVYRAGRPSLLVADDVRLRKNSPAAAAAIRHSDGAEYVRTAGRISVVIFLLVPQATLKKRLDYHGAAQAWAARVPELVLASWTFAP